MTQYWVFAPYNAQQPEIFDYVWAYDLKNGTIAFGASEVGDVSKLSYAQMRAKYVAAYKRDIPIDRKSIWRLYNEMSNGDIIVARQGRKKVIGVGTAVGQAFYDVQMGKDRVGGLTADYYPNFIRVKWQVKEVEFSRQVFPIFALWKIKEEQYSRIMDGKPPQLQPPPPPVKPESPKHAKDIKIVVSKEERNWVNVVRREVKFIHDFLRGRADRPSDERLCDLVQLCYILGLYREGRSLFPVIDASAVNPGLYQHTRKYAMVCGLKAGQ